METQRRNLFTYAVGLVILGLASVLYSADTGQFGWNPDGKTGLFVCGGIGILMALLSGFAGQGARWAVVVALVISFVLLSFGGSRAFSTFRDVGAAGAGFAEKYGITQEAAEKRVRFRGALMGGVGLLSLFAFMRTAMFLSRGRNV